MKPRSSKTRRLTRPHWRRLTRSHVRSLGGFEGEPNYLTAMIFNYRRAIRARRRMAKLAPSYYDPAVVQREALARIEEERRMVSCDEDLEKVYGPRTPEQREANRKADALRLQPPPIHPRTLRAVEREQANFDIYRAAGDLAKRRYEDFKRRRPHDLATFGQMASLLEIAFDFKWLATGFDWRNPQSDLSPPQSLEDQSEADPRRSYGSPSVGQVFQPASASDFPVRAGSEATSVGNARSEAPIPKTETGAPPVSGRLQSPLIPQPSTPPPVVQASPRASALPPETPNPKPESPPPPNSQLPAPSSSLPARRDAYASLARHQRQLRKTR